MNKKCSHTVPTHFASVPRFCRKLFKDMVGTRRLELLTSTVSR